jgi:hypothetical protein
MNATSSSTKNPPESRAQTEDGGNVGVLVAKMGWDVGITYGSVGGAMTSNTNDEPISASSTSIVVIVDVVVVVLEDVVDGGGSNCGGEI